MGKQIFAYAKTKAQISCAVVTAQLISIFVFAWWTVPYLNFLKSKFQAASLLWLLRLVSVGPGQKS